MSISETKRKKDIDADEIEIRLSDIVQFLKDSRRSVIRWSIICLVIGLLYACSKQNEYTAIVKVMPELKSSAGAAGGLGDLKSLAGLAGVNLGSLSTASEAVRPDLYPDIVQSVPFSLHLLSQPVTTVTSQKPQKLQTYFTEQAKDGVNGFISSILSSEDSSKTLVPIGSITTAPTLLLTRRQEILTKKIIARVSAEMDKKSGIITITSQMPDPVVAATVASQTLDYLTTYVTDYRTGKARQQMQFLTHQVNEARRHYETTELRISEYRDRNRSLYTYVAKIEEQRLQADYLLAQSVFSELSKQLEQARVKVDEESPVFQLLEPPQVPLKKSGPPRVLIVIGFYIIGIIIGLSAALLKRVFSAYSGK